MSMITCRWRIINTTDTFLLIRNIVEALMHDTKLLISILSDAHLHISLPGCGVGGGI